MTARHLALCAALALMPATGALAQSAGDFTLGFGLHSVMPKDDNGDLAGFSSHVGDNAQPTFTFEYFIRDNLGIEVLAATPFSHNVDLDGLGKVAKVKHLPPTVSLQYHFRNSSAVTPFVGVGLNYTTFLSDKATGALAGNDLELGDSWGLALHAGLDYAISERGAIRVDARWMDIDSTVKLNGDKIGTAHIDPVVLGVAYVHRF
ncbi:OmpW family outer membrane protein [Frigidibacter sp. MR17.14]|uniref:OmpW/AlkL family protein n=1 Tax=Frigidibacter sp. MR17.14 TaxID=3126509 RepID=UPI003012E608